MIVHPVATDCFWLNNFPLPKPGMGLYNTNGPGQLVLGTILDYNTVCHLHPGEYVQANQEDEPWNTIDIYKKVGEIVLGTQYNIQGSYLFDSFLIGTRPQSSHWTDISMS